ncbi:MAG: acyltransferase [Gemmatimonadota bacterium]
MAEARYIEGAGARIPSLDGLRAIAVGLVILSHLTGSAGFPAISIYPATGLTGVRLFFVISGFLITGILQSEYRRSGTVRLGRFYLRRTFRIFPPYYAFLFLVAVGGALGFFPVPWRSLLRCAAYLSNYGSPAGYPLGHAWSLAVEEQFYLMWPALLLLLGLARARWATIVILLAVPIVTLLETRAGVPTVGRSFETVSNFLAAGCALALWRDDLERAPLFQWLMRNSWIPLAALLLVLFEPYIHSFPHQRLLTSSMQVITLPLLLMWAVKNPLSGAGRLLNAKPVAYVGRLSYSLYLWQQPFITSHSLGGAARRFPAGLLLAVAMAVASFYLVEQPALRWRGRFERRKLPVDIDADSPTTKATTESL